MHDRDLDSLAPASESVTFRGEAISVSPITLGQLPELMRRAKPLLLAMLEIAGQEIPPEQLPIVAMDLIAEHGSQAAEALAIATGKSVVFINDGNLAEIVDLALEVVRVNRDFFTRQLKPALGRARDVWASRRASSPGSTTSTPSSHAATDTPT